MPLCILPPSKTCFPVFMCGSTPFVLFSFSWMRERSHECTPHFGGRCDAPCLQSCPPRGGLGMALQRLSPEQLLGHYMSVSKLFLNRTPRSFLAKQMWAGVLLKGEVLPLRSGTKTRAEVGDSRLVGSLLFLWFMWRFANVTAVHVFGRGDLEKRGFIL